MFCVAPAARDGQATGGSDSETVLGRCCYATRCAIGQCAVRIEDIEVLFIRDVVGVDLRRQVVGDVVTGHQVDQRVRVLLDLLLLVGRVGCVGVDAVLPVHTAANGQAAPVAGKAVGSEGAQQFGRVEGVGVVAVAVFHFKLV